MKRIPLLFLLLVSTMAYSQPQFHKKVFDHMFATDYRKTLTVAGSDQFVYMITNDINSSSYFEIMKFAPNGTLQLAKQYHNGFNYTLIPKQIVPSSSGSSLILIGDYEGAVPPDYPNQNLSILKTIFYAELDLDLNIIFFRLHSSGYIYPSGLVQTGTRDITSRGIAVGDDGYVIMSESYDTWSNTKKIFLTKLNSGLNPINEVDLPVTTVIPIAGTQANAELYPTSIDYIQSTDQYAITGTFNENNTSISKAFIFTIDPSLNTTSPIFACNYFGNAFGASNVIEDPNKPGHILFGFYNMWPSTNVEEPCHQSGAGEGIVILRFDSSPLNFLANREIVPNCTWHMNWYVQLQQNVYMDTEFFVGFTEMAMTGSVLTHRAGLMSVEYTNLLPIRVKQYLGDEGEKFRLQSLKAYGNNGNSVLLQVNAESNSPDIHPNTRLIFADKEGQSNCHIDEGVSSSRLEINPLMYFVPETLYFGQDYVDEVVHYNEIFVEPSNCEGDVVEFRKTREVTEETFAVFPNPVLSTLNIQFPSSPGLKCIIQDMYGRNLNEIDLSKENGFAIVNLDHLNAGLYVLCFYENDNLKVVRRISKK